MFAEVLEKRDNTVEKVFENNSSTEERKNNVIYIKKIKNDNVYSNNTGDKLEINDTTDNSYKKELTDSISSYFVEKLIEQLEALVADEYPKYKSKLMEALEKFDYSSESLQLAEERVQEIIERVGFEVLGKIFQDIAVEKYDEKNILCGICQCLEYFDLEEVRPWGPILMLSLLPHKDENVKAYVISTIDNWADSSLLPVLKNIDCSSSWLKKYIDGVILRLEV